jgi:hypothetical protein
VSDSEDESDDAELIVKKMMENIMDGRLKDREVIHYSILNKGQLCFHLPCIRFNFQAENNRYGNMLRFTMTELNFRKYG